MTTGAAEREFHICSGNLPKTVFGPAIWSCEEQDDGSFEAVNGEYGSLVNYCPYCGAKAPKQVEWT